MFIKLGKDLYKVTSFRVKRYDRHGMHLTFCAIHQATQLKTTGNIVTYHNAKNSFQAGESVLANNATREFTEQLIESLTTGSSASITNLMRDYNDSLQIDCSIRKLIQVSINVHIDVVNKHIKKALNEQRSTAKLMADAQRAKALGLY